MPLKKTLDSDEQRILDAQFDSSYLPDDDEGFEALGNSINIKRFFGEDTNTLKRTGSGVNTTKVIPFVLYSDEYTATQLTVLLEMIKFCMEKSAEGKSDDVKEFSFNVHVKNRSNVDFKFSIGDEPMPSLAYENDVFIGH